MLLQTTKMGFGDVIMVVFGPIFLSCWIRVADKPPACLSLMRGAAKERSSNTFFLNELKLPCDMNIRSSGIQVATKTDMIQRGPACRDRFDGMVHGGETRSETGDNGLRAASRDHGAARDFSVVRDR